MTLGRNSKTKRELGLSTATYINKQKREQFWLKEHYYKEYIVNKKKIREFYSKIYSGYYQGGHLKYYELDISKKMSEEHAEDILNDGIRKRYPKELKHEKDE